jgi:tetratricopeptide (TPR) repeat protein
MPDSPVFLNNETCRAFLLLALSIAVPGKLMAQSCPDLAPWMNMAANDAQWPVIESQLMPLMPLCLQDSNYFALLGAAQLNNARLGAALESLERALLLNPDNGGAQIDYAQALFVQGQLFSALALNERLLTRQDLPDDLREALAQRQRSWQSMTRQTGFLAEILAGHDNNLNSAPSPSQITLTLSGDSVVLPLNPEYQPISGPYLNMRLAARYRQLTPENQHNAIVEVRGRISEDRGSDMAQMDLRYAFIHPGPALSWQASAAVNNLFYGGSPLYTATEAGGQVRLGRSGKCAPFMTAAAQHQLFHEQSRLNAVEGKLGIGAHCSMTGSLAQQVSAELSLLGNHPLHGNRPGGDRQGWQLTVDWQLSVGRGQLLAQLSHTRLEDSRGYNPLLADGSRRWLRRTYGLFQYSLPVSESLMLQFNLYRQNQASNLELFRSTDATAEVGVRYTF